MNEYELQIKTNDVYALAIPNSKGEDGITPVVTVTDITGGHNVSFSYGSGDPRNTSFDVMNGTDGEDGDDGITPTVTVTDITGGHNVAFSYGSGDSRNRDFNVLNGTNGTNGADGEDGITPAMSVSTITGGHRLTVSYGTGDSRNFTIDIMDGSQGSTGPAGPGVPTGGNAGQILTKNSSTDYDTKWTNKTQDYPSAYSTTGSAEQRKKASCSLYQANANSYLHILLGGGNEYAGQIYLNVNGTGDKPVYINGAISSSTNYALSPGSYIIFYDGTNYHFRTDGSIPNVGNASILYVTLSYSSYNYRSSSATVSQIKAAADAGKTVIAYDVYEKRLAYLHSYDSSHAEFTLFQKKD